MLTRSRKADLLLAQDLESAAAPEAEGDTSVIFGTLFDATSPRFIMGPAFSRIASSRALRPWFSSSSARVSAPVIPSASAYRITQGIPLSISVQATLSMWSTARPVGSRHPHIDPATSPNISRTGACLPGTPSICASPA